MGPDRHPFKNFITRYFWSLRYPLLFCQKKKSIRNQELQLQELRKTSKSDQLLFN